jgi:hypothetical protein
MLQRGPLSDKEKFLPELVVKDWNLDLGEGFSAAELFMAMWRIFAKLMP